MQARIKAEGAVFRVQRAMEDPNAAEGTITWGGLLLSRLDRSHKEDFLDCELEELVRDRFLSLPFPLSCLFHSLFAGVATSSSGWVG